MTNQSIACQRLINLLISRSNKKSPAEVVSHLGALQAQDYAGAKWSVGLRLPGSTDKDIEEAIAKKTIVRTWPMRGTLHFVAADDIHWMRALLTPRPIATAALRREMLGLTEQDFTKSADVFVANLTGGKQLLRDTMYEIMDSIGVDSGNQRGLHVIRHLAMDGLLCFGSHEGKQPSFALLDEWCPKRKEWSKDEGLSELAKRYFSSHGPAAFDDFVRWSGLAVGDARQGLNAVSDSLYCEKIDGLSYWMPGDLRDDEADTACAYLLPGFDEFMLGYKDRSAALAPEHAHAICPGNNGMFISTIVVDGFVVGTWSKVQKRTGIEVRLNPFEDLSSAAFDAIEQQAARYGEFLGQAVVAARHAG